MPIGKVGGGGGGGGGGSANIGALLRQTGETAQGLFISSSKADYDWHMRGVERQLEEAAVPSELTFENQDQDASVVFKAPVDWIAPPETVNAAVVRYFRYAAPRPAIAATYRVGAVSIASQQVGSPGNNDRATVAAGTGVVTKRNAHADIEGDRGPSTATTAIRVRSPDIGGQNTASALLVLTASKRINVAWNTAGAAGNGFRIRVEYDASVPDGTAAPAVDRDASNNVTGITVGVKGTVLHTAISTALNGVSVGGTQLVTATHIGGSGGSRAYPTNGQSDIDVSLDGGSDTGFAAKGTIASSVNVTYYKIGPEGNGFEVSIRWSSSITSGNIQLNYEVGAQTRSFPPDTVAELDGLLLVVNGSITRAAIAEVLNGVIIAGHQVLTATAGAGLISYGNNASDEDLVLSGGTSGTGAGTNFGRVTVALAAGAPAVSAKAGVTVVDVSNSNADIPNGLTITHPIPGTAGNGWNVRLVHGTIGTYAFNDWQGVRIRLTARGTAGNGRRVQYLGANSQQAGTIQVQQNLQVLAVTINPAATTVGAVVDAVNNASTADFRAEVAPSAARADTFTPPANSASELRTLGGADNTTRSGALNAQYAINLSRLTLTNYVPSVDTVTQVVNVITGLPTFQTGDGTNPGDVVVASSVASATDRLKVTSNEGGNTDYPFSGGLASGKRAGVRPFTTINYFDATGTAGVLEVYARSTYTNFNQNLFVNYNSLLGSNTVTVNTGGTGTNVLINGTVTLNAIIAAFNSEFHVAGNSVRARLPSGASGTATVTWTADGRRGTSRNFTGGMAPTDTLSADYTAATNVLALTAHSSDTFDDLMDTIAALDEFQRSRGGSAVDGSMPGDIWLVRNGTTIDFIKTPATTSAAALQYDFANGVAAADRSPLAVTGTVDTAPAAATIRLLGGVSDDTRYTYYKTGTEGNGFRVSYYWRYEPDLDAGRASATMTLGGVGVRFRWYNEDTYGNGVTVRVRRHGTSGLNTEFNSGTKQFTLNLSDGTYTYRQIQNLFARMFHPLPPIERVLGAVRMEVGDSDLDSEFTVSSSFATITTAAFGGAAVASRRMEAEYLSSRELRLTQVVNTRGFQDAFFRSEVTAAINAARWGGLQLISSTTPVAEANNVGNITVPADAAAGATAEWFDGAVDTLADGVEGSSLITITGLLGSDTAQNIADAYTGPSDIFTLPSGSTAVGSFSQASRAAFTGGRDALGRQQPSITLHDDGSIGITAILHDNDSANTTLRELTEALWRTTYTTTDGLTAVVPFANVVVDLSGGGATTDPIRNQTLQTQGTGGSNFIPESGIEALVRPEDELNGPNIEVRYHADVDTLQEILTTLLAQGAVDIVDVYGTDLSAVPEDPPFIRDMWPESGDTNVTVTGATAGLTFQDEGANLGRGTTVNFTGGGVTVTGAGLTKQVSIRGVDQSETQRQVSEEVARDVKDFARTGGPVVPVSEIADGITRDTEVASAFGNLLSARTPDSANLNDKMPFRTSADAWGEATTTAFRALFKPNLPTWSSINGLYVFKPGDIVPHADGIYYCLSEHQKANNGPDTGDANWLPLRWWWGDWTARYYPRGAFTTHNSGIYAAKQDIFNTDPSPDASNNTKWERIDPGLAIVDGGAWSASGTWQAREIVRHSQPAAAIYLTRAAVRAGIEPGVANNWDSFYYRLGWVEGAPDSLVDIDIISGELIATTRAGTEQRKVIPTGTGTTVVANPSDASDSADALTDIRIGTTDFAIPPQTRDTFSVWWEETSRLGADAAGGRQWALGNGGVGAPFTVPFDCEVVAMSLMYSLKITASTPTTHTITETTVGFETVDLTGAVDFNNSTPASRVYNGSSGAAIPDLEATLPAANDDWGYSAIFVPEADSPISIASGTHLRPVTTAPTSGTGVPSAGTLLNAAVILTLRRTGTDAPPATTVRPHVSSFRATSGDLNPAAGTLAAKVYGLEWTIAQSDHVGAARILGFKGPWDPNNATVLSTIPTGNIPHGNGSVVVPNGVELAADETYRFRLQVFDEHVTNPTLASAPASYQDIVVTAHAAATAAYHGGYVAYDANDADEAATLARITDFTNDTQTSNSLPSRLTVNLPEDSTEYQLYLLAKADETQPSGFTSAGFPATNSFFAAQDVTIATIAFKAFILRPGFRFTSDNNGEYFGITS